MRANGGGYVVGRPFRRSCADLHVGARSHRAQEQAQLVSPPPPAPRWRARTAVMSTAAAAAAAVGPTRKTLFRKSGGGAPPPSLPCSTPQLALLAECHICPHLSVALVADDDFAVATQAELEHDQKLKQNDKGVAPPSHPSFFTFLLSHLLQHSGPRF